MLALLTSRIGTKKVMFPMPRYTKKDVLFLKDLIEAGKCRAIIDRCYPLAKSSPQPGWKRSQKTGNIVYDHRPRSPSMNHPTCRSARPHARTPPVTRPPRSEARGGRFQRSEQLRPWTCQTDEFLRLCDQAGPGCALATPEGSATRWDAPLAPGGDVRAPQLSGVPLTEMPAALAAAIALALPALSYTGDPRER